MKCSIVLTNSISVLFPDWQVRWFFMILVHRSHLTSKLHEMNGRERQKVMDTEMEKGEDRDIYGGREWSRTESWFYSRKQWRWEWGGVQEASCDDRVWLLFMLRHSLIHVTASTEGGGESLQVDELVHQQQGARQAGQAGFRATTVTTRVASWNWPGETRGGEGGGARRRRGGKQKERREAEEQGVTTSSKKRGGWGRERRENREKNLPI